MATGILSKKIEEITRFLLQPTLNESYIKTLEATDKEATTEYLRSRSGIITQSIRAVQEHAFDFRRLTDNDLADLIGIYESVLEQLYGLPVPKNLIALHREQLRLTTIEKSIFEAIANYRTDALSASIAISLYETAFKQIQSYRQTLRDFMATNNIKL